MKTGKQIRLVAEDLAKKCIAQAEAADIIELSGAKLAEIPELIAGWEEVKTYPIITDGCIIVSYDGGRVLHILFDLLPEGLIELKGSLVDTDGVAHYAQYTIAQNADDPLTVVASNYNDAATAIYSKQRRRVEEIDKYIDAAISENSGIAAAYLAVMAYLNFLLEHPEQKEIERKGRKESARRTTKKRETVPSLPEEQKPREIVINGVRIITRDKRAVSAVVSKTRRRIATSWSVIGHYRHYKSGKVSYVRPHVRGQNKDGNVARHIIRIE